MQALECLACVYATFEEAWANLENEKSEGDIPATTQQHQARCQDEVKGCRDSLDEIVKDLTNFRAFLKVACDDLADAGMKTIDLKRKADDAYDKTCSRRDRCRRATKELTKAEEVCIGVLVKDTTSAPHALSCGVPDRDSIETKHFGEALEMIDAWQARCSRRSSDDHNGHETTEVVLVERPQ